MILLPSGILAQTTVTTTGGATNTVPLFTGSATLGNSPITQSGAYLGIWTPTPSFALDVSGLIRTSAALIVGDNSASNGMHITNDGSSTGLRFWSGTYGAGSLKMQISESGNVGIGTPGPGAALHVARDSVFAPYGDDGQLIVGGITDPNKGVTIGYDTTSDFGWIYSRIRSTAGSNLVLQGAAGNVGIGTTTPGTKLEVNGSMKFSPGSGAAITFADATVQSTAWNGTTLGGDYAESVQVSDTRSGLTPGDVLVIDPAHPGQFLKASDPYSTMVAGVYSTKPGLTGRRLPETKTKEDEVPMAMIGIVPTRVSAENGPIHVGDLVVASATPGYAMKATDRTRAFGAVLGKALGSLDSGTGKIEVLIVLQ